MKKYRNLSLIIGLVSCLILFLNFQKTSNKLSIEYLSSEKFGNSSNLNLLYFQISNSSSDTLFLSRKNIKIEITKNGKKIKNFKIKTRGQILHNTSNKNKSKVDNENIQEIKTISLKKKFAESIFKENFNSKVTDDFIVQLIQNDCIVVLPNKNVNYSVLFNNSQFDKEYKVSAKYVENKIFTYFIDEDGKRIDIFK